MKKTFDLSKASPDAVREIRQSLGMDPEHVLDVQIDPETGILEVELSGDASADRVEKTVKSFLRTHRLIARKVLGQHHAQHHASVSTARDVDAELAASDDVLILGDGLTGLRGQLLSLFQMLEQEFRDIAHRFEAEAHRYPALMPSDILDEVGYLEHFPQHVTFCCHLPDNLPILESMAAEARTQNAEEIAERVKSEVEPPRHALTPGVCLPCYRQLRDVELKPGEVRTLTMQNHVYRYEGVGFRPLARAWDFSVRDIVFFGAGADMERYRSEVMEVAMDLCRRLDLQASLELAHDPFFLDVNRDKVVYQRMGEVKYELLLHLPHREGPFAASSFNLHRDFYTSVYNTRQAGEITESACMGFGLERWLYGFLSQKGLDPDGWPAWVKDRIVG